MQAILTDAGLFLTLITTASRRRVIPARCRISGSGHNDGSGAFRHVQFIFDNLRERRSHRSPWQA
jgi:hypothetical protein